VTIRPTASLGRVLQILIAAAAGTALVADAWLYARLRDGTFVLHIPDPEGPPGSAYWTGTPVPALASMPGNIFLVAGIVWLFWQHRATENLWARGDTGLRTRPGWAVGWWFIPVAWWFMPCVTMLELDRRSTPDGRARRASRVIVLWWIAWLAYWFVPVVGFVAAGFPPFRDLIDRTAPGATTLDLSAVAHAVAPWILVTAMLEIVAGALAIAVIRRVDAGQAMLAASSGGLIPVPRRPDVIV
jgi:hypothetical protein